MSSSYLAYENESMLYWLLCHEILFYAEIMFASFEVHAWVISTSANHTAVWAPQNVFILNAGILKFSKMYITSTTHLNMT